MSILDVLFLLLVFLFPILIKSIQEKQRIEQAKSKKTYKTTTSQVEKKKTLSKERKSLYEERYKTKREPLIHESRFENLERITENNEFNDESLNKEISSTGKISTKPFISKLTKRDLVKGIILKEILSEPKCMKHM